MQQLAACLRLAENIFAQRHRCRHSHARKAHSLTSWLIEAQSLVPHSIAPRDPDSRPRSGQLSHAVTDCRRASVRRPCDLLVYSVGRTPASSEAHVTGRLAQLTSVSSRTPPIRRCISEPQASRFGMTRTVRLTCSSRPLAQAGLSLALANSSRIVSPESKSSR